MVLLWSVPFNGVTVFVLFNCATVVHSVYSATVICSV